MWERYCRGASAIFFLQLVRVRLFGRQAAHIHEENKRGGFLDIKVSLARVFRLIRETNGVKLTFQCKNAIFSTTTFS